MAIKIQGTVVLDYDGASYSSTNIAVGASALASITTGGYNVGVGNSALQSNTTGVNNVGVGYQALYTNTTGTNNVGVGYFALYTNTIGISNVGVGNSALRYNTTGNFNVGVGYIALQNNTTGVSNVGVGYGALNFNTIGINNVGVGHNSLYNTTTGVNNVGVGYRALYNNTIGSSNVGVGYSALYANTTGEYNVGVGVNALYFNTTGISNVGVGYGALNDNTIGINNVGVGYNSLQNNTTGISNVGVGYAALYDQTTAQYNTAIGHNTGRGITTGSYNTIIGAQVTGLSATLTNTVIIADGAGNKRIYADSTGNVGIKTSSPSEALTVIGNGVFGDATTKYNRITINGGHVGDGDNDYGLTINSFEPAITLLDRSSGAGSSQIYGLSNGGILLRGDTTNDGTIGHTANITDFDIASFEPTVVRLFTNDTERMRIDSAGNVGIGTSSPSYLLELSTNSAAKPTSNVWTVVSDGRIKNETGEYTKGLDAVCGLRPITYTYKENSGFKDTTSENISIIAQEAQVYFPECVNSIKGELDGEETDILNWDGHALTFALVNAVKELKAKIETLEARVAQLEGI